MADDGSLTRDDVAYVARLARLDLTDEELDLYAGQLAAVIDHAAEVAALDTDRGRAHRPSPAAHATCSAPTSRGPSLDRARCSPRRRRSRTVGSGCRRSSGRRRDRPRHGRPGSRPSPALEIARRATARSAAEVVEKHLAPSTSPTGRSTPF